MITANVRKRKSGPNTAFDHEDDNMGTETEQDMASRIGRLPVSVQSMENNRYQYLLNLNLEMKQLGLELSDVVKSGAIDDAESLMASKELMLDVLQRELDALKRECDLSVASLSHEDREEKENRSRQIQIDIGAAKRTIAKCQRTIDQYQRLNERYGNLQKQHDLFCSSVQSNAPRSIVDEMKLRNVQLVWSSLKSKKKPVPQPSPHHPELLQTITLENAPCWLFGSLIDRILYVRTSQQEIANTIMSDFERVCSMKQVSPDASCRGCIIKGTPGIGKSAFLNLLVYMASAMDVDVVIHDPTTFVFVLRSDGTVVPYATTEISLVPELKKHKTLYLFDPDEERSQAVKCAAFTVVATSLDVKHFSNLRKMSIGMRVLWMYPWQLKELYAAHLAVHPLGRLTEQEIIDIVDRFENVGGSLRVSFADEEYYHQTLTDMDAQLRDMTVAQIASFMTIIHTNASVARDQAPHLLFHCYPSDPGSKVRYSLGFSSNKSRSMIASATIVKTQKERERLIEIMLLLDSSQAGIGYKYESNFHYYMECYRYVSISNALKVYKHTGKLDSTFSVVPTVCVTKTAVAAVADAIFGKTCVYVVPTQSNDKLVDSFYVTHTGPDTNVETIVYCLQITASPDHRFEDRDWDKLQKDIHKGYEALVTKNHGKKRKLTLKYCWVCDATQPAPKVQKGHFSVPYKNIFACPPSKAPVKKNLT